MGLVTHIYGGVTAAPAREQESVYDQQDAVKQPLMPYQGKVVVVVNTASKCGFARQYDDFEALYQKYAPQGLIIVGFPSNDFLRQEPGTDSEIAAACRLNYGVTFPIMPKGPVSGREMQPLFSFLTERGPRDLRGSVKWNFEKFLIDREGHLIGRWRSYVSPLSKSIVGAIENALNLEGAA